jgi:hypothetical protein
MTSEGLGEMLECDSAETCTGNSPLVSMGGQVEGLAYADLGVRIPICTSGNLIMFLPQGSKFSSRHFLLSSLHFPTTYSMIKSVYGIQIFHTRLTILFKTNIYFLSHLYSQTTPSMRKSNSFRSGVADRNTLFVFGIQSFAQGLHWSSKQFISSTFDHHVLGQVNNNTLSNELGEREKNNKIRGHCIALFRRTV